MALENGCTGQELINTINSHNDNLDLLNKDGFHVGDIRNSFRSDLGEKYLLCNGDRIDQDKYPKLFDLVDARLSLVPNIYQEIYSPDYYLNGLYIRVDGSTLYYTETLGSTAWRSFDVGVPFTSVHFVNGHWILIDSSESAIYYSKQLNGSFTKKVVYFTWNNGAGTICAVKLSGNIDYFNGKYYVSMMSRPTTTSATKDYPCIGYAQELGGTWDWTYLDRSNGGGSSIYGVVASKDRIVAFTSRYQYYIDESSNVWTKLGDDSFGSSNYYNLSMKQPYLAGNYEIAKGYYLNSDNITQFYATPKTEIERNPDTNGMKWIGTGGSDLVAYMPDGNYYVVALLNNTITFLRCRELPDGLNVFGEYMASTNVSFSSAKVFCTDKSIVVWTGISSYEFECGIFLPLMSGNGFYYIKAKE